MRNGNGASWPRLYVVIDAQTLSTRGVSLREFGEGLRAAGVALVQYRDKVGSPREVLSAARVLRAVFAGSECQLVMNDRADLAMIAEFDGVHVGQGDLPVEDARRVVGEGKIVGVSTHTDEQVRAADTGSADYVATGPVFQTETKADAAAVIGLEGVHRARTLTTKPLVAIGGITRENARSVVEAGADSVAVISELLKANERPEQVARDFLDFFR